MSYMVRSVALNYARKAENLGEANWLANELRAKYCESVSIWNMQTRQCVSCTNVQHEAVDTTVVRDLFGHILGEVAKTT